MYINLCLYVKFPEPARTRELGDKSLIGLPCFVYWLILKRMHLDVHYENTIEECEEYSDVL